MTLGVLAATAAGTAAFASALPHARQDAELWAHRFGVGSRSVETLRHAIGGLNFGKVSAAVRDRIDSDTFRARGQLKRQPVAQRRHASVRSTVPGHTIIMDGFGPHPFKSPITGLQNQYVAADEATTRGWCRDVRHKDTETAIDMVRRIQADAESYGHKVRVIVVDRGSELRSDKFASDCAKLGVRVDLAATGDHNAVGAAEVLNDVLTRMAEIDIARAGKGPEYLLDARRMALFKLNRRPAHGSNVTREQHFTGRPYDASHRPPYIWGSTVVAIEDEAARGPNQGKGALTRAQTGTLVGMDDRAYSVRRSDGSMRYPKHVRPLNEHELIRRGDPSAVGRVHADTQTPPSGSPLVPAPKPPKPAPSQPAQITDLPKGTRVRVFWLPSRAEVNRTGDGAPQPYDGVVTEERTTARGERHHCIQYDGWAKPEWHNLASPRHVWARVDGGATTSAQPAPDKVEIMNKWLAEQQSASSARNTASTSRASNADTPRRVSPPRRASPPRRVTRAQSAAPGQAAQALALLTIAACGPVLPCDYVVSRAVTRALESTDNPVATFNATVFQMGNLNVECHSIDDLERARVDLEGKERALWWRGDSLEANAVEACKAEKNQVWIKNADGTTSVQRVPSSARQVLAAPDAERWIAADQTALDSLLLNPGNVLVPMCKPRQLGLPIGPCVTTRKLKLDAETGGLDKYSPYKSRHAFDNARHQALAEQRGIQCFEPTSSTVADDLLIKTNLSMAAAEDMEMCKLDVGDAYLKGCRKRPPTYMALPETLPMYDADGEKLCIEFGGTPTWGEAPAGREWQDTLMEGLIQDGWTPADNVPCLLTCELPDGTRAQMLTIVDDILIMETKGSKAAVDRLYSQLTRRYGKVKIERDPTSFVGYTILRDRERRALTVTMASPIAAAAKEHIPEYVDGKTLKEMGIPEGAKLRQMAEALTLEPAVEQGGKAKRTPIQRTLQTIVGKLRWYEKCDPELTKTLHCVSSVATRPPPEALLVAKALLASAYDHRQRGITYGGGGLCQGARLNASMYADFRMSDGATPELECTADSTWGGNNVYAILMTLNGGAIAHVSKRMHLIVDSSMESEAVATGKAGEIIGYAREILRAIGHAPMTPTFVGTDNAANALIASGRAIPSRSRHCLRRYLTFLQRVKQGAVQIGHVRDTENPSDFLTKFVSKEKVAASVKFATNHPNAVTV